MRIGKATETGPNTLTLSAVYLLSNFLSAGITVMCHHAQVLMSIFN